MTSTLSRSRRRSSRKSNRERHVPRNYLREASRYLLLAVLVIAPWTYGGVLFQTQIYLYAALLVSAVLWLCSHLGDANRDRHRFQLPLLVLPVALGVIFGSVQLMPLLSVAGSQLGPPVSDELPIAASVAGFERQAISIYPLQTRVVVASLSFALLACFLATQLFCSQKSQLLLFGALALSGMALSFFGLAQKLSWNRHLFWHGPEIIDGKPFAAWVNRNNAAGFLNLTFAAALGMLVWVSFHRKPGNAYEYDLLDDGLDAGISDRLQGYLVRLGRLKGSQLLFGLALVIIASGVVGSASRGGIVSLGVGLLSALLWLGYKRQRRLALIVGLMIAIPTVGLLSWLGISSSVRDRFAGLNWSQFEQTARFKNWDDTFGALPEIWSTGSGLGTYGYVYRPYQQHRSEGVYRHAENQYVETLIEGGVVGLGLLILAIVLGYAAVLRLSRSRRISREDGVALVGLVALTTQCCHAFLDYGLTIPSNMLVMATLMGAVTGRAARKLGGGRGSWRLSFPRMQTKAPLAVLAVMLIANGLFGWIELSRAAFAERALRRAESAKLVVTSPEECRGEVDRLLAAVEQRPDDTELLMSLAEFYVMAYQLEMQQRLESQLGRELTSREINDRVSLAALYVHVNELEQDERRFQLEHLKQQPLVADTIAPARSVVQAASAACEWLPQVELSLAYLSVMEEPREKRISRLERIVYLAPYEPRYLFPVGYLARAEGDDELCLFVWKRAFELHPQVRFDILREIKRFYPELSLHDHFLPQDPSILRELVDNEYFQKVIPGVIEECLLIVEDQLEDPNVFVTADHLFLKAFRHHWRGEYEDALAPVREVIRKNADDLRARILEIELLIKLGRWEDAEIRLQDARPYLPSYVEYDRLSKQIEEAKPEDEHPDAEIPRNKDVLEEISD